MERKRLKNGGGGGGGGGGGDGGGFGGRRRGRRVSSGRGRGVIGVVISAPLLQDPLKDLVLLHGEQDSTANADQDRGRRSKEAKHGKVGAYSIGPYQERWSTQH